MPLKTIILMVLVLGFRLFKENKLFDYFVVKTEFFEIFALGIDRIVKMSLVLVSGCLKKTRGLIILSLKLHL